MTTGGADQCVLGLNFETARPRRNVLSDYSAVMKRIYSPAAYYRRVRKVLSMLDCPVQDESASKDTVRPNIAGIPLEDIALLWRLTWRIAFRQPRAFPHFCRMFYNCARCNPRALPYAGILSALFLHLGPFAQLVISHADAQIAAIDAGTWTSPLTASVKEPEDIAA